MCTIDNHYDIVELSSSEDEQFSGPNPKIRKTINDDTKAAEAIINVDERSQKLLDKFYMKHDRDGFTQEFIQLVDLCYDYEFSDGMERIVNRNLVPAYMKCNKEYVASKQCQKFLELIIIRMKANPRQKFSCIKEVIDNLKAKTQKKRVQLITLDTDCSDKSLKPHSEQITTIDIDSDDQQEIIHLEHETNREIRVEDEGKENSDNNCQEVLTSNNNKEENELLEPANANEIRILERMIQDCKEKIKYYEELEVTEDNLMSPYIVADYYKEQVVKYYKSLCKLTGGDLRPKATQVKLHVPEGHPVGPTRRLEEWLYQNADENGDPPFPDFIDVVKCVTAASQEDKLDWGKSRILIEARHLFTVCGRAIQKRRQKREWRDLVAKVDDRELDDPADVDLELSHKLNRNREVAKRKEADILDLFCNMEKAPKSVKNKITVSCINHDQSYPYNVEITNNIEINGHFNLPNAVSNNADGLPVIVEVKGAENFIQPENAQTKPEPIDESKSVVYCDNSNFNGLENNVVQDGKELSIYNTHSEEIKLEQNAIKKEFNLDSHDQILKSEGLEDESVDFKPIILPFPIDPNAVIVCSDSEDYSSTDNEESDFELDTVLKSDNNNLVKDIDVKNEELSSQNEHGKEISSTNNVPIREKLKLLMEFDESEITTHIYDIETPVLFTEVYDSD